MRAHGSRTSPAFGWGWFAFKWLLFFALLFQGWYGSTHFVEAGDVHVVPRVGVCVEDEVRWTDGTCIHIDQLTPESRKRLGR